ncbi:Metallo-dependent phosphatase-like protein [Zychaea mexicana]|uniref:Metallo-dependent phosphatase-like protein n=1 Tax=Zychaea mexicana TaxID=64656 RepID=UPI0022FEF186|nr:Metallo-dependent phosphatase-like protein [Zychaea mexicana]KAI9493248.1 Metallo-dependent phosphatase-like protein [Zychaea mexicana]
MLMSIPIAAAITDPESKRVETPLPKDSMDTSGMDVTISNIGDTSNLSPYDHLIPMITINNNPFLAGVRRLFAIGDVHGCIDEFNELISKIAYNHDQGDRIILLGDLMNKGPDSVGVILRAKELKACNNTIPEDPAKDPITLSHEHIRIVRNMTAEDYQFLNSCPLILGIPALNSLFVHGGVDPRNSFESQVPYLVMNMRSIQADRTPTRERTPVNWADEWNRYQEAKARLSNHHTQMFTTDMILNSGYS